MPPSINIAAKLLAIAIISGAGVALPLSQSAAASATVQWPPPPIPGVHVNVIYPSVAVDTPLYRFVGDDHRQITFRLTESISYRFVYDHHNIRIWAFNPTIG